jgi:Rieske Fe-S protein
MTELIDQPTRRAVLGGVAAASAGAVLAACGGSDTGGSTSGQGSTGEPRAGGAVGSVSDVPVGGGTVFKSEKIVVTQPTEGDFKAFSAVCQHQGCTVGSVNGDIIQCPCHGSQYSAEDGSVKKGPTTEPLPTKKVTVEGDQLIVS